MVREDKTILQLEEYLSSGKDMLLKYFMKYIDAKESQAQRATGIFYILIIF